ncbi:MAG: carboxymuconolactone decarboxylase family protein [Acidimicrobiales bacterium]
MAEHTADHSADHTADHSAEERAAAAARTYANFAPDVEPGRLAASLGRRMGPLGHFAYQTVGEMWDRPGLNRRDRSLLVISSLAAQARDEELVLHTQVGLRHGLTRTEIEEILPHVAAYAGFPAAVAASRQVDDGLRIAEGTERLSDRSVPPVASDMDRDEAAAEVVATMRGREPRRPSVELDAYRARFGGVGEVAFRWAFGEIWSRPYLDRRDRSVVAISIMVTLAMSRQLHDHIIFGIEHGLTPPEIREIVTHLSLYIGIPRAMEAMTVVDDSLPPAN